MIQVPGARIAVIHRLGRNELAPVSMCRIRTLRISEALARLGHHVDIVADGPGIEELGPRLRRVPVAGLDWHAYDLVKAEFHAGFDRLLARGGGDHPFILVKFGSVVGTAETPGVYFFGDVRAELEATQHRIAERARYVTILTEPSAHLWRETHGPRVPVLMVPTGVDATIPPPRTDPYARLGLAGRAVLFAGNIYSEQQPEVNLVWQDRLNRLGRALRARGLSLVAMGRGDIDRLDPDAVLHVGEIPVDETWDWQRGAIAGIVLAHGPGQHNESSKIYYYLRTGLPVICEAPVPNAGLITESGCGAIVAEDDIETMADVADSLAVRPRRHDDVADWVVREHSWDERAARYAPIIAEAMAEGRGARWRSGAGLEPDARAVARGRSAG